MTKHGSLEHFRQVLIAHEPTPYGTYCRCGARVTSYREHIREVWRPFELPETDRKVNT